MKDKAKKNRRLRTISFFRKTAVVLVAGFAAMGLQAQNNVKTITVSTPKFANSLVEKWAAEYSKENPDIAIKFVKADVAGDLTLTVNGGEKGDKKQVNVGLTAVLPVVSDKNIIFGKQLKNGITGDEFRKILFGSELEQSEDDGSKPVSYTVYTQPAQSATTKVLLSYFGKKEVEIPWVIVTGDDKYLIESVLNDSTGISYGNLGLIYEPASRQPVKGLRILPIDPDNSGKLKKEEQVYSNLDQLVSFLENTRPETIPTSYLSFSINKKETNPLVEDFVNWVKISGQQFNHQFGFLKASDEKDSTLTQK
jgi:ABC-type phosphate transport system substrate-binding protein